MWGLFNTTGGFVCCLQGADEDRMLNSCILISCSIACSVISYLVFVATCLQNAGSQRHANENISILQCEHTLPYTMTQKLP
jgi:hypothetical protein